MRRTIRFWVLSVGVYLVCGACARPAQPPMISNETKEVLRFSTIRDNMAAYVSVYCFWYGGVDGETTWDTMPGVVLDEVHILTIRCDDNTTMSGWEESRMEPITVGPFDGSNENGHGPWAAHQVTKDSEDTDFVIIATDNPMPVPSVVLAAKTPELCDLLYTVTSYSDEANVQVVDLYTVSKVSHEDILSSEGSVESDFSVLVPYSKQPYSIPSPAGVFNRHHEFVGFAVGGQAYVVVPKAAPEKFKNGSKPYGLGYDIAGMRALNPLLREAGIQQPRGEK